MLYYLPIHLTTYSYAIRWREWYFSLKSFVSRGSALLLMRRRIFMPHSLLALKWFINTSVPTHSGGS